MAEPAARTVDAVREFAVGESRVPALAGVCLEVGRQRLTAVVGPSGSGKSTLLHCLAGLDRLTSGSVFVGTQELGRLGDDDLTRLRRQRIGVVFQAYNLVSGFTVADNITLPLVVAHRPRDRDWFEHIVDLLGIGDRLRHTPAQLSGGEQQRVAVARALITRPDIVLADEPTGNLDSGNGAAVLELLRRSVDELGQTVLMVTHDAAAASTADTVVSMRDGRIATTLDAPTREAVIALTSTRR